MDLHSFSRPGLAVDVILFTIKDGDLKAGLIKREGEPYFGKYALPGRFVRYDEKIETTARMALEKKANINHKDVFLEQLYTFGDNLERDTRIRTVTIVYYGLVDSNKIDFQKDNKMTWHSVYKLPKLAFDHKNIISNFPSKIDASNILSVGKNVTSMESFLFHALKKKL